MKPLQNLHYARSFLLPALLILGLSLGSLRAAQAGIPAAVGISTPDTATIVLLDLDEEDFTEEDIVALERVFDALNMTAARELAVQLVVDLLGDLVAELDLNMLLDEVAVVFMPPPVTVNELGLADAAAVNELISEQFEAAGLNLYVRVPVTRVDGPTGEPNIRVDIFVTTEENRAPNEEVYYASIEVPEEFVDRIVRLLGGGGFSVL